jgi:two-component system LytT family response regulator
MNMRAIVADDEPLARARLRRLLQQLHDVEIVAECADGAEAAEAIRNLRPDVAFLDIQMPELDGFGVLVDVAETRPTAIVFVTAYDQHAIRAFEEQALDYLLKPVNAERLQRAVDRARSQVRNADIDGKLAAILRDVRSQPTWLQRIAVRSRGKVAFVQTDDITRIESAGNYARVFSGKENHLIRETLTALEGKLDPQKFVRIHRSTIVNVTTIRELRPWFAGDYVVVLHDGTELTLSRTYRAKAAALLGT